jgi:hypothetical protein
MIVLEVLQSFIITILVGYLSFTNGLAETIEARLGIDETEPVVEQTDSLETNPPSEELTTLSKLYAQTKGVTRVLRDNTAFQEALVVTSGDTSAPPETAVTTKETVLSSLVNILCEYSTEEYTRTTTGTGFFISDNGVILTNAHVAQFLLLEAAESGVSDAECVVRNGDPAMLRYRAELLFISPTWILNNAKLISDETPRGTGEYDYALLYVSDTFTDEPLPESFPALPLNTNFLPKSLTGASVYTAGYPAEKLFRDGARAKLEPKIADTILEELYTFGSNYADIFAISSSQVGEQGASGGPVVHPEDGAIGLIVTKGDVTEDGEMSLRALTLSYIDRTITEETGFSLYQNASGDLAYRGNTFKEALVPFLAQLLSYEIQ